MFYSLQILNFTIVWAQASLSLSLARVQVQVAVTITDTCKTFIVITFTGSQLNIFIILKKLGLGSSFIIIGSGTVITIGVTCTSCQLHQHYVFTSGITFTFTRSQSHQHFVITFDVTFEATFTRSQLHQHFVITFDVNFGITFTRSQFQHFAGTSFTSYVTFIVSTHVQVVSLTGTVKYIFKL